MLMSLRLAAIFVTASLLYGCAHAAVGATEETSSTMKQTASALTVPTTFEGKEVPAFNQLVLQVAAEYPTDGTHDYFWPKGKDPVQYDGVSEDVIFKGVRVMKGESMKRTFCCGITLEVFAKAYQRWTTAHGAPPEEKLTPANWAKFQRLWFVEKLYGPGPSAAVEAYGLGRQIPVRESLPGDFVQLWRTPKEGKKTGSGHSVIFLNWIKDEKGTITGMKYWSSNESTKGIAPNEESFSTVKPQGGLNEEVCFGTRIEIPTGK